MVIIAVEYRDRLARFGFIYLEGSHAWVRRNTFTLTQLRINQVAMQCHVCAMRFPLRFTSFATLAIWKHFETVWNHKLRKSIR